MSPTYGEVTATHRDVSGFQTIATCQNSLKNSQDKSATSAFVSGNREIGDVRDKTREIGDVADKSTGNQGCHRFVADITGKSA